METDWISHYVFWLWLTRTSILHLIDPSACVGYQFFHHLRQRVAMLVVCFRMFYNIVDTRVIVGILHIHFVYLVDHPLALWSTKYYMFGIIKLNYE